MGGWCEGWEGGVREVEVCCIVVIVLRRNEVCCG